MSTEIDSERKENKVETDIKLPPSSFCTVIVEQPAVDYDAAPPVWSVSVELLIRDPVLSPDPVLAQFAPISIGPFSHPRQIVAFAAYPLPMVRRWTFWFWSSSPRAKARVLLHAGTNTAGLCGLFPVPVQR